MKSIRANLLMWVLFGGQIVAWGQNSPYSVENLLHFHLPAYQFTIDNRFRLAAFGELKGKFDEQGHSLSLEFGGLGAMFFFANNCMLRVADGRVLHLNRFDPDVSRAVEINEALAGIFERIALMSNYDSDLQLRQCVDKHLARINLEPFYKIFVRHLLLRHGKYDPVLDAVSFCSAGMAREAVHSTIRKPAGRLVLELDANALLGLYGDSKGEVYIHTVKRPVYYATGEEYTPNVSAFKIFVQQLLMQSVQYIVVDESNRLEAANTAQPVSGGHHSVAIPSMGESLYSPYNWIPMMLGMLRNQNINVGDKDVSMYLIEKAYFPRIYQQMTQQEKAVFHRNFPQWINPDPGTAFLQPIADKNF